MMPRPRSHSANRLQLAFAGILATTTSPGAMVVFDVNDVVITGTTGTTTFLFNQINLQNGTYATSGNGGGAFKIWTWGPGATFYAAPQQIRISTHFNTEFAGDAASGYFNPYAWNIARFAFGASIGPGNTWGQNGGYGELTSDGTISNYQLSAWQTASPGIAYVGLRMEDLQGMHYGWLEVDFGATSVTFRRFAFESATDTSVLAGVPEASTLGYAAGLFGLVAAAHIQARRRKQAAASDKFLALAAGEKVG